MRREIARERERERNPFADNCRLGLHLRKFTFVCSLKICDENVILWIFLCVIIVIYITQRLRHNYKKYCIVVLFLLLIYLKLGTFFKLTNGIP